MKAQMAVETLLIYGITILIVMLAIGALIGFGVLDIGGVLPEKCEFIPKQFACTDYSAQEGEPGPVNVEITNQVGKNIDAVRIENIGGASACNYIPAEAWTDFTPGSDANDNGDIEDSERGDLWVNGDAQLLTLDCTGLAGGSKTDLTFDLIYRLQGKDLDHTAKAEVQVNTREE
jgi:hypothetical protein